MGNEFSPCADPGRRRLLGLMGAGGAAALTAGLLADDAARAGHDGTNVLHLGTGNAVAPGAKTGIRSDVDAFAVDVDNASTMPGAGGLHGRSVGGLPGLQGLGPRLGVFGISTGPDGGFDGEGNGVAGLSGTGIGVYGESRAGSGVEGRNTSADEGDHGAGVQGHSLRGPGVRGASEHGAGVEGASRAAAGVVGFGGEPGTAFDVPGVAGLGFSGNGVYGATERSDRAGVLGEAVVCLERGPCDGKATAFGVRGTSEAGVGVRGDSQEGTGVEAVSPAGTALRVRGRAVFSTAGSGVVPFGAGSAFVAEPAVTPLSHITVTLVGNPGVRAISWVERRPGAGFVVHLTASLVRPRTPLTYLVVEPG